MFKTGEVFLQKRVWYIIRVRLIINVLPSTAVYIGISCVMYVQTFKPEQLVYCRNLKHKAPLMLPVDITTGC